MGKWTRKDLQWICCQRPFVLAGPARRTETSGAAAASCWFNAPLPGGLSKPAGTKTVASVSIILPVHIYFIWAQALTWKALSPIRLLTTAQRTNGHVSSGSLSRESGWTVLTGPSIGAGEGVMTDGLKGQDACQLDWTWTLSDPRNHSGVVLAQRTADFANSVTLQSCSVTSVRNSHDIISYWAIATICMH